jgi:hypothetical protein
LWRYGERLVHISTLVLAFVLRVQMINRHPMMDAIYSDMGGYHWHATELANGTPLNDSAFFQPIGLSVVVAALMRIGIGAKYLAWIHVVFGVATVHFSARLGKRIGGWVVGAASGVIIAAHFPLLYLTRLMLAETLFSFFVVVAAYLLVRYGARSTKAVLLACASLVFSFWFKGFSGPILLVLLMCLLAFALRSALQRTKMLRAAACVVVALAVLPLMHGYVSHSLRGKTIWSPSASGLNLVEGKCPWKRNEDNTGAGWWSPLYVQQGKGTFRKWDHPFTDGAYFRAQGIACIKQDPLVLLTSLRNVAELFVLNHFWPAIGEQRFVKRVVLFDTIFAPLAISGICLALVHLVRRRRTAWFQRVVLGVVAPFVGLVLTVYVFKSEIRFRVPFDPIIVPLGVLGQRLLLLRMVPWAWRTLRTFRSVQNLKR